MCAYIYIYIYISFSPALKIKVNGFQDKLIICQCTLRVYIYIYIYIYIYTHAMVKNCQLLCAMRMLQIVFKKEFIILCRKFNNIEIYNLYFRGILHDN